MMRDRLLPGLLALACLAGAPAVAETRLEGLQPYALRHCVEPVPFELWRGTDMRGTADRRPACTPEQYSAQTRHELSSRPGKWIQAPQMIVKVPEGVGPKDE